MSIGRRFARFGTAECGAVDADEVTDALAAAMGEPPRSVRPIHGGWASFTFEVDGRFIARFPRNAEIARCTQAELALLPQLAGRVQFAVPEVRWQGSRDGFPFFVYEAIPGHPLTAADVHARPALLDELAEMLRQLHAVDPQIAMGAPGARGTAGIAAGLDRLEAWRARYAELRARAERHVVPLLPPAIASDVERAWDDFAGMLDFRPALVHADLGVEHLLVSGNRLSGVIDWETAGPGDPAIDFVGIRLALGAAPTERVLDAYGGADAALRSRIPHYVWLGAVHAVLYGVEERRPEIVAEACDGLATRLRAVA